jgi:hypothetical protein
MHTASRALREEHGIAGGLGNARHAGMRDFAQVKTRRGGETQFKRHRTQKIAVRVGVLLHHAFVRQAFQHAMHRGPLQAGARGKVEQARTGAVVRGNFAQQQQRAFYTLGAGQAAGFVVGFSGHGSHGVLGQSELCEIFWSPRL